MTAEIVIMNKDAIAMAADSAVTSYGPSGHKVFTTANKIFALSNHCPVGIMFYANAAFMEVPWETVVKMYRQRYGQASRAHLQDFADDFIRFLQGEEDLFPPALQERFVQASVGDYFSFLLSEMRRAMHETFAEKGQMLEREVESLVSRVVADHHKQWVAAPDVPDCPRGHVNKLKSLYSNVIKQIRKDVFEQVPMTKVAAIQLSELGCLLFLKQPKEFQHPATSGIVIAGFGTSDVFPALQAYEIEGIAAGVLKIHKPDPTKITFDNVAVVQPFAQADDVHTFMQGVSPAYQLAIEKDLEKVLQQYPETVRQELMGLEGLSEVALAKVVKGLERIGKKFVRDYAKGLQRHRRATHVGPVINAIGILPKADLAALAESLVNLTSMKRKFSMDAETVAGPIDVALISKGDGFVWTKRKHYFSAEYNPHFMLKHVREGILREVFSGPEAEKQD